MLGANKSALIPVQSFICDKKHQVRFVFFVICLLSFLKLKIHLVPVWRPGSAGVRASSVSPTTSLSHPATCSSWMLCSSAESKISQSQRLEIVPQFSLHEACVCVYELGFPLAAAELCASEAPGWAQHVVQTPSEDLLCGWSNIKVFRSSVQPWKCFFEVSGSSRVLQTFI